MKQITPNSLQRQSGLSLVELMIAMVLGLVVISAVFNTYLGSQRSSSFSNGIQEIQENGRYAITTLQRAIRLAGYTPDADIAEPVDILASGETAIAIRLKDTYDCNGQSTASVDGIAVNTYAFDETENTITCEGNVGGTAMVVVEHVERMRLLWGIDTDDDGVPEQYTTYDPTMNSSEVVSMRVGVLIASEKDIRTVASEYSYVVLDEQVDTEDKKARHIFTSTVMLRNKP